MKPLPKGFASLLSKMKSDIRLLAIVAVLLAILPAAAHAQSSAAQRFSVFVPTSVRTMAPAIAGMTYNPTVHSNSFSAQTWTVQGNSIAGINVSFATQSPFVNTANPNWKRDVKLNLGLETTHGPATWTIEVDQSSTDYLTHDIPAIVNATSTGLGLAHLRLVVTFVADPYGVPATGDYVTTVVGTVVGK
jgi:hypothetical protein